MNKSTLSPMGRRILIGMTAAGISTEQELARQIGTSTRTMRRWMRCNLRSVDVRILFRISDRLQLSSRWLISGKGSPTMRRAVTPTEAHMLRQYKSLSTGYRNIIRHCLTDLSGLM